MALVQSPPTVYPSGISQRDGLPFYSISGAGTSYPRSNPPVLPPQRSPSKYAYAPHLVPEWRRNEALPDKLLLDGDLQAAYNEMTRFSPSKVIRNLGIHPTYYQRSVSHNEHSIFPHLRSSVN
ncbi:unnamed protein product [Mesocestoides corti]|nr:unnamed protein product [Mesocestoides corti]